MANALVGNGKGAAALEVTLSGARQWRDLRRCGHKSLQRLTSSEAGN